MAPREITKSNGKMMKFTSRFVWPLAAMCIAGHAGCAAHSGVTSMTNVPTTAAQNADEPILESFLRFHDVYLETWRDGLEQGDTSAIEPYYQHLRSVQFARPGWDTLEDVTADTLDGVRQTVNLLTGWRQVITDRAVFVRNEREVVVFFRKTIENDQRSFPAFMMQVWVNPEGNGPHWLLVRETVEK
jgi:hypothetical protein